MTKKLCYFSQLCNQKCLEEPFLYCLIFVYFIFNVFECFDCMYICDSCVCLVPEDVIGSLRAGVMGDWEPPCEY